MQIHHKIRKYTTSFMRVCMQFLSLHGCFRNSLHFVYRFEAMLDMVIMFN